MKLRTAGFLPDTHRPYHNVRAYNCALEILSYVGINELFIKGDYADFYDIHQHGPKDPRIIHSLTYEVEDVNKGLDEIDKGFPGIKKRYVEGNHEDRLRRYIQNKAPELFGLVDCQELFKIAKRPNWSWHRYWPDQKVQVFNSDLWVRHTPLGSSAIASLRKAMCSHTYGHNHVVEIARVRGLVGELVAWSDGWLGDKRKDEVFGYVQGHYRWQCGVSFATFDEDGNFEVEIVKISEDGRATCRGRKFKG